MSKLGNSLNRRLAGGDTTSNIDSDLRKLQTQGQPPVAQRAVVLDVIYDPNGLTEEEKDAIADVVNNAELVDVMPINSVVARIVSNNGGTTMQQNTILFPFFQSHIMLPVQPGEQVYVLYEDYHETGALLGYWLTRTHGQSTIEDPNYTHLDRRFDPTMNPVNYSTEEKQKVSTEVPGPGFQNGGNTPESQTLVNSEPLDPGEPVNKRTNAYEQIFEEAKAAELMTCEPVPRWKKRPQELVIQGSNNTLMCFGEDRTGPPLSETDAKGRSGTIDMVVGRGRIMPAADDEEPVGNAPRVIKNSRGLLETNKAPYRRNFTTKDNINEGDPDFIEDASRIYISMQTEADQNFNIQLNPEANLVLPDVSGEGSENRAHIVGKSDHIRFIARQDDDKGINGTILLIRQGNANENLGYFFINQDGHIQIESEKIFIGQGVGSGAEDEPYILWSKFNETRQELQNQIDILEAQFKALTEELNRAFLTPLGNMGAPIPTIAAAAGPVLQHGIKLSADLADPRTKAEEASAHSSQSSKIYGE